MREKTDRFALAIKDAGQLPPNLQSVYEAALKKYGANQLAVYAPPLTNLLAEDEPYLNGCVLLIFDEQIFIGIKNEENPDAHLEIPFEDIIYLETGSILLHSWFKIAFGREVCRSVKIPFNTVGEVLFQDALRFVREKLDAPAKDNFEPKIPTQSDLPLKFINALHDWLVADEKVIEFAFQPEIRVSHFLFSDEQIAPPSLAVLTDREFLLITQEPVAQELLGEYGKTFAYCPLSRLQSVEIKLRPAEQELADFRIMLANGDALLTITSVIGAELAPQFDRLSELVSERDKEKIK